MARQLNCWEFMKCGREPDGSRVAELGICPSAVDSEADGLNGGTNGGRICWAISGSFCDETDKGTFAKDRICCFLCDFYQLVHTEEDLQGFSLLKPGQLFRHDP